MLGSHAQSLMLFGFSGPGFKAVHPYKRHRSVRRLLLLHYQGYPFALHVKEVEPDSPERSEDRFRWFSLFSIKRLYYSFSSCPSPFTKAWLTSIVPFYFLPDHIVRG